MNHKNTFYIFLLIISGRLFLFGQELKIAAEPENWLGQIPPGARAELFAPGIVSLGFHELGISFGPDGSDLFYIMSDNQYALYVLVRRPIINGNWSEPEILPFSGKWSIVDYCRSPDGNIVFFSSNRPPDGVGQAQDHYDIWMVSRQSGTWGEPVRPDSPLNSESDERVHSITASSRLYFTRDNKVYFTEYRDGEFSQPESFDPVINEKYSLHRPFISADESYLLFHSNHPDGIGGMDLYIIFRDENGAWGTPRNLGPEINSPYHDFGPAISPDGKYLFFSSYRPLNPDCLKGKSYSELIKLYRNPQNGYATLYWVETEGLMKLKNEKH